MKAEDASTNRQNPTAYYTTWIDVAALGYARETLVESATHTRARISRYLMFSTEKCSEIWQLRRNQGVSAISQ